MQVLPNKSDHQPPPPPWKPGQRTDGTKNIFQVMMPYSQILVINLRLQLLLILTVVVAKT